MFTQDDLLVWYRRLGIAERTQALIDQIRSSHPARRVGGGRSNVSGQYPSRKMGVTIQFESHRVELAAVHEMEHDPAVLEFFDQPPPIILTYNSAHGRRLSVRHTPDFFVLRVEGAGWEEWKTEEDLHRLAEHNAHRYRREGPSWRCPPGEAYAAQFGLSYRVRSSKEIHWGFQRNLQFLEDYLRADPEAISPETREKILAYAHVRPGIALRDFLQQTSDFASPDDVYLLIAAGRLYVDLYAAPLAEPAKVQVFSDRDAAHSGIVPEKQPGLGVQSLRPGTTLVWDNRNWQVANIGDTKIALLSEDGSLIDLPTATIESLVREGRITQLPAEGEADQGQRQWSKLLQASVRDLQIANRRAEVVRRHLSGASPPDGERVPPRTLRRWLSSYHAAERAQRAGYLGLLPRISRRGNHTRRLPEESVRLMSEVIEKEFENIRQKNRVACWAALKKTCSQQDAPPPSFTTFCLAVRRRGGFQQTLKREGPRAAYQHGPFHFELDLKTPRHGDRPFEICHTDHTLLDIELTDSTGKHVLGRPWMTLMMDAFSRRVLAVSVDFDEPSYRSCMMILRECVRRHNRLPQYLVVDGGPEFSSTYFETLLAQYECTKKTRPPAQARFGAVIERIFGVAHTQFVHNLLGNTQITGNVRQVTKSVNPKEWAVWPLASFVEQLYHYLYEIYDTNIHPALGQSPRDAYHEGFQNAGLRLQRLIPYDHDFLISTLPSTPKGTAMVSRGRGVKINYLFYWSEAMADPQFHRQKVPVRFDPFDLGTAYVFLDGQWTQCHSDYYRIFQGRSQKELLIVSQELRARNRDRGSQYKITASKLADAFQNVDAQESVLLLRRRAWESQAARERAAGSATLPGRASDPGGVADSAPCDDLMAGDKSTFGEF